MKEFNEVLNESNEPELPRMLKTGKTNDLAYELTQELIRHVKNYNNPQEGLLNAKKVLKFIYSEIELESWGN